MSGQSEINLHLDLSDLKSQGVLDLLPKNAVYVSSTTTKFVSDMIDEIIINILHTNVGSEICKLSLQNRNIDLYAKFGLSAKSVELSASSICSAVKSNSKDVRAADLEKYFLRKPYVIAFSDHDKPFESWTTRAGSRSPTLIVVDPNNVKVDEIYRSIIHELYMALDIKSSFPFPTNSFGLPVVADKCEINAATSEPLIRYAFNVIRAEQVENKILNEIGFSAQANKTNYSIQDLKNKIENFFPFADSKMVDDERNKARIKNWNCFDTLSIDDKLSILENESLVQNNGQTTTLWNYLSEAEFTKIVAIDGRQPGPRPSIGTGTGTSNKRTQEQLIAIQNKKDNLNLFIYSSSKTDNTFPQTNYEKPSYLKKKIEVLNPIGSKDQVLIKPTQR